jgi:STE24 endopeptidase
VPAEFAEKIPLAAHQKAADYTAARPASACSRCCSTSFVLIGFTLLGGLQWLSQCGAGNRPAPACCTRWRCCAFAAISGLLDLPFDYYRQFVLEERFGFNKMSVKLFFGRHAQGRPAGRRHRPAAGVGGADADGKIGRPVVAVRLAGVERLPVADDGALPDRVRAPVQQVHAAADDSLKARIEGLMQRVGFASKGLFVMDGSKRSAHGNAYFSGFGANKRIVFFDTLLSRLAPQEIEAVLAHELGHFKLKHIVKRIVMMFALSLASWRCWAT